MGDLYKQQSRSAKLLVRIPEGTLSEEHPGTPKPSKPLALSILDLVAEWIHFTLFGIILPTIKLKVYTFWGLNPILPEPCQQQPPTL